MAFPSAPANQGTSPRSNYGIQERDSLTASAEKKPNFSLGGIRSWITKKKDEFSEGGLFAGSRSQQSRKRDDSDQSMHNRRHSSTDIFECVDQIEQDVTTFQNDASADTLAQALSKFDDLQKRNSSMTKKISQLERELKRARRQNESLMEQLQGEQQVSEKLVPEEEEGTKDLREKCEARAQRIKSLEKQNTDLAEQVKNFEIDCHVEVEENEVLKSEIESLKHKLETLSSEECIEGTNSDEETIASYRKVLTCLKKQVDDLNDDMVKLRDHSKKQSRQILKLKQQSEMTEMMEVQIKSEERIRHEAEEESVRLKEELNKANVTVTTLQTERKTLDTELRLLKEESARFIKDQNEFSDLRKEHATLVDEHEQVLKSMRAMATLSVHQTESEKTVKELEHQLESIESDKNDLHGQLQAANAQIKVYESDFKMERRDREVAQKQSSTYRDEYEGVKKQLFEHQEALSAVEQVNKKLNQEVQRARKECERLEQEVQAKSSQVKQYAKEVERLKQELRGSAQAAGSSPVGTHGPPDDAGFSHVNDLYKTALDDNEHLSYVNSNLHDQVEELKKVNTELVEKLSYLSKKVKEEDNERRIARMPERDPQMPPSPIAPNESHGTLSQAQQASSVAESEQIILSAPLPGSSHTSGTESLPQGNPHQLVDKPVLQETTDTYNSNLPPSSEAKFSPKLLDRKPMTEPNGQEVEYVASGSSSQSLDSESSDRRRDVETANVEDSITQYENPLQKELDDEIHLQAAEVIQEVSGGRRNVKTDNQRPFDPNLVCPMCRRQFRIGEIQKFKKHVNTCTGTDD